jgi:hypothetical protein
LPFAATATTATTRISALLAAFRWPRPGINSAATMTGAPMAAMAKTLLRPTCPIWQSSR